MINFEDAKQIAVEYIDSNRFFVEQAVIEKAYGWYLSTGQKLQNLQEIIHFLL